MPSLLPFVWLIMTPVFTADDPTHWFVGPNEIFDEIQPAIDAAAPGDIIWVEPTKDYASFTIYRKGVSIRTLGEPFRVDDSWPIQFINVPRGERASVSGIYSLHSNGYTIPALLVYESEGDVDVENMLIEEGGRAAIIGSDDVSITDLIMDNPTQHPGCGRTCGTALLYVERSMVELTGAHIRAPRAKDYSNPELDGDPAIEVVDSRILIAGGEISGGGGGNGPFDFNCAGTACSNQGGSGGPALIARRSFVQVVGSPSDRLLGGDAGEEGACCYPTDVYCLEWACDPGEVAAGIPAIISDQSVVEISGVTVMGGEGEPSGPPSVGEIDWIEPPYPVLRAPGSVEPGVVVEISLEAEVGSAAFVMVSPGHDWVDSPRIPGLPLRVDTTRPLLIQPLGVVPPSGRILGQVFIPPHFGLSGRSPTMQGLLFLAEDSQAVLSNSVTRVLGLYQETAR